MQQRRYCTSQFVLNMFKYLYLVLLLTTCWTSSLAQENLIPNPGFEEYYDCDFDLIRDPIEDVIPYWYTRLGRPRYFNEACQEGQNSTLPHFPFEGNSFLGLFTISSFDEEKRSIRDYAIAGLLNALDTGKDYYLEYYGALTFLNQAAHSHHGIHFVNELINETDFEMQRNNPPLLTADAYRVDTVTFAIQGAWYRHQHCFSPDSNYKFMVVGNFTHIDSLFHEPFTNTFDNGTFTSYDNFFLAEIEMDVRLDDYEEEICAGDCITLSTNHTLIDGVFEWQLPGSDLLTSADSTVTICYDTPGVYDVRLDVQHCTGDYSGDFPEAVTVLEAIDFVAPTDVVVCPQETFSFAIPDTLSVQWSDGITDLEREISEPGVYEYTLDNGACSEVFSFELQYAFIPEEQIEEHFACQGDELSFQGQEITQAGVFVDTLSTLQGCDSIYQTTIFEFYEDIPFELDGELGFCPEEETMVRIISSHQDIFWSDGDTQADRFFSQAGTFNLIGTDANGCEVDTQLQIIAYPQLGVHVQDLLDFEYSAGTRLPVTYAGDIADYVWTPAEVLSCPDCPFPTLEIPLSGIYQIEVMNAEGCTDLAQLRIEFARIQIYLPTAISKTTPNFVNRLLFAQSNSDIAYSLRVYNRWGGLEYESDDLLTNDPAAGWIPQADDLGVFVYYIKYLDENGVTQLIKGEVTVLD